MKSQTRSWTRVSFQGIWERYRAAGFELVTINKDPPDEEVSVRQMVSRYRYRFPVLLDHESEACNRFNPTMVFPFHVLFDRQGKIDMEHRGHKPGDELVIEKRIQELTK